MCGIIAYTGQLSPAEANQLARVMIESQIRGRHASGIAWSYNGELRSIVRPVPMSELLKGFDLLDCLDSERLYKWFTPEVQRRLPYQIDKIKCCPKTVDTILSYQSIVGTSQKSYFDQLLDSDNPQVNFDRMWSPLKSIYNFGRFSTWNHCQALKHVAGYNVEPLTLMLGESDSIAFTDGLAYAFGYPNKTTQK